MKRAKRLRALGLMALALACAVLAITMTEGRAWAEKGSYRVHIWWRSGPGARSEVTYSNGSRVAGDEIRFSMGDLVTIEGDTPTQFVGRSERYVATVNCIVATHMEEKTEVKYHDWDEDGGGFLFWRTTIHHHDQYTVHHPVKHYDEGPITQRGGPFRLSCTTYTDVIPVLALKRRANASRSVLVPLELRSASSGGRGLNYFQVMPTSGRIRLADVQIPPGILWLAEQALPDPLRSALDNQVQKWVTGLCDDPVGLGCLLDNFNNAHCAGQGFEPTEYDGGDGFELWIRVEVK